MKKTTNDLAHEEEMIIISKAQADILVLLGAWSKGYQQYLEKNNRIHYIK